MTVIQDLDSANLALKVTNVMLSLFLLLFLAELATTKLCQANRLVMFAMLGTIAI
jgi:hypothetical protein